MSTPVSPSSVNLEVEVKFYAPELTAVRQRLVALGANLHKPRVFERNVRFDTPDERLRSDGELLRLRQDTAVRLTYKGIPPHPISSEAKVREELEIEVSDFDTAALICQRLGFRPLQTYEKYRETFVWRDVEIVLDEMPFGNFVELEGAESAIKETAVRLELDWSKRLLTNYLALMETVKTHYHLSFDDLTFANFKTLDIVLADLFPPA